MRKHIALTVFALAGLAACDDSVVTRPETRDPAVRAFGSVGSVLEIKFREELRVRVDAQGRLRSERGVSLAALQTVLDRLNVRDIRPLLSVPADRLAALVAEAQARSGLPVPDMLSWHHLALPPGADADAAVIELRTRPEVEHAYLAPPPAPPPVTPDFSPNQDNYFGAAPSGTEQVYARSLVGGRGVGMELVDLEYDWTFEHEDLGLSSSILITGERWSQYGLDHGTAVLGILVGRENSFGVIGGAPDATIRVASPMSSGNYTPADAITNASSQIVAGDVLLLEQQTDGPEAGDQDLIPLEWISSVYDAIRLATQAERVVIEAAANGGRNLDAPLYNGRFDRNQFNSGAIIVGAGDGQNARLSFSDYGSRVDVQAHGTGVTTTGYGDLFGSTANDQYTAVFGGTSSASAIVAAATTTLQGYRKHNAQPVLTPVGMASILKVTGSPQTGATSERIGPKPNLRAAIGYMDAPPPIPVPGLTASCNSARSPRVGAHVTQNAPWTTLTLQRAGSPGGPWITIKTWENADSGVYSYGTGYQTTYLRARAENEVSQSDWSPTVFKAC